MSKEIYISTTPHETRLAIVEDEQLAEIYYERENEYTLAGSIYNGKVTRVLPGMQSSFVDIGLERDAFLYVTDFMEEQGDAADFDSDSGSRRQQAPVAAAPLAEPSAERDDRGRGRRKDRPDRSERRVPSQPAVEAPQSAESTASFDEPIAPAATEQTGTLDADAEAEGGGSRRWRGRRGRRRGRTSRDEQPSVATQGVPAEPAPVEVDTTEEDFEVGFVEALDASAAGAIEINLVEPSTFNSEPQPGRRAERGGRSKDRHGRGDRDRGPRRDAERSEPAFDNSYAGYMSDDAAAPTGEPVLLPGESIRKYRDPAEVAAEDAEARRNAPAQPDVMVVAAPSIEIVGWDGGAVLPGETLGRNRGRSQPSGQRTGTRDTQPRAQFRSPDVTPAPSTSEHTEVSPAVSATHSAEIAVPDQPLGHEAISVPEISREAEEFIVAEQEATLEEPAETSTEATVKPAAISVETEYEPEEGASASVGDAGRRDLRRFEQPSEPAVPEAADQASVDESDNEIAGSTPDLTTYDLQASAEETTEAPDQDQPPVADPIATLEPAEPEFTSLHADGEMISQGDPVAAESQPEIKLPEQNEPHPESPSEFEGAVHSSDPAEADQPVLSASLTPAAEQISEPEIHAYGDGDFHEEEIDEELDGDDFNYPAALASVEDGEVEYEEETLDGADDPGSVLHELTENGIDADDEDEEEVVSQAGGFTEADFGGESATTDEEEDAFAEPARTDAGSAQHAQRDGSRRPLGGGRDRRGGRNSGGDRGRGGRKQSMQTTDLPAINELLKPGQEILVQIAKEPIAKKGARITSHIALPGRFLVFMPTVNHTGVSRKISSDEERRRLKSVLLSEKGDAQGGFIVRTAADGASEEELRNDLRFLIQMWTDIKMRSESSKSPALIYHDLNLVERILRDQVTDNFSAIWVDTEQEYERVLRFLQRFQPSLVRRVKLYTKETPLFEHFGVTAEIDKALKSKVWLKSGGSIVINQTEALVAIDINTGKYVGKTARLEDTILKTNLDAIPEIVRQIRLRDLGGIIVIDFIDMDERKNRAKVMQALEDAMRMDRAPSKILPFNDFGLVIMTRKRVKQSLERTLCMPDPVTDGTGMIKSPITIANEIYVEMRKMYRHLEKADVMLRVHPEVVKTLKANGGKRLQELEEMTRKTILVKSDPALSPEAFDIH